MQIQPSAIQSRHHLPPPTRGHHGAPDPGAFPLPVRPAPHSTGPESLPHNYPSPPMSNPPSPPRRHNPTSSPPEYQSLQTRPASRTVPQPIYPPSRPESTAAFRREPLSATIATLPSPGLPQPVHSLYSHPSRPPTLGHGALLEQARYFPQRAAIPGGGGSPVVPTEIGRNAASALRGARSSRRGKTHVQKACVNCKKAHLSCDSQRPCARCVGSGKQDTCHDVEHKKRGRPRLRDDRDSRLGREIAAAEQGRMIAEVQSAGTPQSMSPYANHRRTQSGKTSRPQRPTSVSSMHQPLEDPRLAQRHTISGSSVLGQVPPPSLPPPRPEAAARVFTNINFRILRANHAFREQFARGADIVGRQINEFVDPRHEGDLHRLQSNLREEREALNPMALPPIFSDQEQEGVVAINEAELNRYLAEREFSESWMFSVPGIPPQPRSFTVRLGKTSSASQTYDFVLFSLPYYPSISLPPPMPAYGAPQQLPAGGVPPTPWEPQFGQQSPGPSSAGFQSQQPGSGPTTPSLSLQSLASSLPPSSSVAAYGLSSASLARQDPGQSGYFPAQPRSRPTSDPTALPRSPAVQYAQAPPVPPIPPNFPPPPPTPSSTTSGFSHRPLSTVSEPFGAASSSRSSVSRPTTYHGRPRTYSTMSTGENTPRNSRTSGDVGERKDDEDEDARKRRRLNIREITD